MSPLFTAIVVILALLAVMGIVVGVANDAVNFLNSALGSKVAPRRVILWVAAAGILVGTLTSSGMMEVARSGVFYPGQFSFQEIMMLFLGMMLGNVLLLDLYNTLGLPTSTTVSMVFGLLGAAVAAALFRIAGDPGTSLPVSYTHLDVYKRQWEYRFYVDVTFDDPMRYRQAIDAARPLTSDFRILGEYAECPNPAI